MESKLIIITGPKNSGKTLKAKEIALGFNNDEIVYQLQPLKYISRISEYVKFVTTKKTKIIIIDDINDSKFLFNMMMIHKYKRFCFENKNINIVLVCEPNINSSHWMNIAVNHYPNATFINL